jgi:hypothetical protein
LTAVSQTPPSSEVKSSLRVVYCKLGKRPAGARLL